MKLGVVTWIGYGPLYVAEALDLWKPYGLKVTLQNFPDPAVLPGAIRSGALAGGLLTYDQLIGQVAKGDPMRAVMPLDFSNGGDAVVATTDLKDLRAIKGQKIAFAPLSPSDFLLSFGLRKAGLSDRDIVAVGTGPEAVPAALASGQLKVGVTYEPMVSQIVAADGGRRFHVIFSSKDAPGLLSDVLDALERMRTQPAQTAKLIGKALGISADEVIAQQTAIHALTLTEMQTAFTPGTTPESFFTACAAIAEILADKGQIARRPRCEDTLDRRFIDAALQRR
ncbi:MAG: ABC transporter substrate-binding protein [Burkholderiales bacterium]|nr:ABC transporter substrate-binding protein [Burkholderiales bacterium]